MSIRAICAGAEGPQEVWQHVGHPPKKSLQVPPKNSRAHPQIVSVSVRQNSKELKTIGKKLGQFG